MRGLIAGMIVMAELVIALFFLKFWRRSRDGLFAAFSVAFLILAFQRAMLAYYDFTHEPVWVYLLRLLAFVIILAAVIVKNVAPARRVQ